jgi:hypothetical protein
MAHMYVTIADVQARMPQFILTATSKPAIDDCDAFIDDIEAQFNAVCATLGYIVPITGTTSVSIARATVSHGVIAQILTARAAAVGGDAAAQTAQRAQEYYEKYLKYLTDEESYFTLSDAPQTPGAIIKHEPSLVRGLSTDADCGNPTGDPCYDYLTQPRCTMDQVF